MTKQTSSWLLTSRLESDAKPLLLVLDNLNAHFEKCFVEIMGKKKAKQLLKKIEFHYTPKHASWLNVAEIEIGVMDAECTGRRIGDKKTLTQEVRAWRTDRNRRKKKIDWRFTKQDADRKLSKHYVTYSTLRYLFYHKKQS